MNDPESTPDLILFNKPFRVMSQFTASADKETLANYINIPAIYPAGRLDYDSEGLMVLTGIGSLQHSISHPQHKLAKTYWAQVEGEVDEHALSRLRNGVELNDGPTAPAEAQRITAPVSLWPRQPPVRYRAAIPTSWIALTITEGRNRQVRRMTAAVGFPTLRLIRVAIGPWQLGTLQPGEYQPVMLTAAQRASLLPQDKRAENRTTPRRRTGRPTGKTPAHRPGRPSRRR